jgi:hypothetical protein
MSYEKGSGPRRWGATLSDMKSTGAGGQEFADGRTQSVQCSNQVV